MSRIFPPKEDGTPMITTTVRIPAWLDEKLRAVAKKETRSLSEVVQHCLRYSLQEWEAEQERAPEPTKIKKA